MDGVLVDSERFIARAAIMMFAELGVSVKPEDFHPFVGTGENSYLGGVAEKYGIKVDLPKVKARTYEIFGEIARKNLFPLPGAGDFVSRCRKKGLKLALVTSADKVKMEINLSEIGLPPETFNTIITGEDVVNKKPFPDIYIKAAERLGLKPEECLVVEDAVSGIRSGKTAGSRCLAVTTSYGADALHEADWIFGSLLEVPDEVIEW
jgi:HAD superfamily hydrolase (TIGR01509 family)